MDIYFVRHGQTGGNTAKRHQRETTSLTATGRAQAAAVAEVLASHNPTHLIVSDRVRAIETGVAIAAATDLVPETTTLVSELHRPKVVYGYRHASVRSFRYLWGWFFGRVGTAEAESDEGESYASLRKRIIDTQTYLSGLPADARVVVVSHAVYITLFAEHINNPRPLSFFKAITVFKKLRSLKNTSITHVRFTAETGWELISFGASEI